MADATDVARNRGKSAAKGIGKKLGPLPIWAWAGIAIVGGYFAYTYFKNRSGGGTSAGTGGGNVSILGGGGQVAPLAASSGAPSENASPAQSLNPDVLSALTGLSSDLQGLSIQEASDANASSQSMAGFATSFDAQANKLDAVAAAVSGLTLAPYPAPKITINVPKASVMAPKKPAPKKTVVRKPVTKTKGAAPTKAKTPPKKSATKAGR